MFALPRSQGACGYRCGAAISRASNASPLLSLQPSGRRQGAPTMRAWHGRPRESGRAELAALAARVPPTFDSPFGLPTGGRSPSRCGEFCRSLPGSSARLPDLRRPRASFLQDFEGKYR